MSDTVPSRTLRTMLPDPDRRPKVGFLLIVFRGDQTCYSARFVGGLRDEDLVLKDPTTRASRPVTEADFDRQLWSIHCSFKPSLKERLQAGIQAAYHLFRARWRQLFRTL